MDREKNQTQPEVSKTRMGVQEEEPRGAGVKGWHLGSVSASGLVVGPSENKEQGLKTGRR